MCQGFRSSFQIKPQGRYQIECSLIPSWSWICSAGTEFDALERNPRSFWERRLESTAGLQTLYLWQ